MFQNVIVGVDGRPTGRDAIALAARLVDREGTLTLAHVHGDVLRPLRAVTPGLIAAEREESHALLERERAAAEVEAQLMSVVSLSPGRGLHDLADELHADLIVVGSSSHGLFGRAMLGDDTRGALNGAPCAVAVASRGYAEHPLPLASLGVGYDGSRESDAALQTARKLAAGLRSKLDALQVVSLPSYAFTGIAPPALGDTIQEMVHDASERMGALEGVGGRAVYGLPGEELAAFGEHLDLLIVGSRGYGPIRRLVLGSTSDHLQRHARCSLLVLPRTAIREEARVDDVSKAPDAAAGSTATQPA